MKQILQNLGSGETILADVPVPAAGPGQLVIATRASLVSLGTERMLVSFGRASLLSKARQQPEKIRQVLAKIKTDGLWPTVEAVRTKLAQPIPLGYCNAGIVIAIGSGVTGWSIGDRVLSNGPHSEVVAVPVNLCARIPDDVSYAEAAFTVVGAIGLQGIRLLKPTLGESFAVTGLGLIGLLAVQLLKAHGCRVLGIDFDGRKCELARSFGAETVDFSAGQDPILAAQAFSRGQGLDGVLLTAATTSSEPVNQAALMCRKRGRLVQVGATGLELQRANFYEKELSLQVSCSYGPGRYDPNYEDKGLDYPAAFVRWTEQRNFEAVLEMMSRRLVRVDNLISQRLPFDSALTAYSALDKDTLGIVFEYSGAVEGFQQPAARTLRITAPTAPTVRAGRVVVGVLGAGNYTQRTFLPALAEAAPQVRRKLIVSGSGLPCAQAARKFGFEQASTDATQVWHDSEINTVFLMTRHNAHARQTLAALRAGKHVFVEKPLCLTVEELAEIEQVHASSGRQLMVGFNRRFSPHVVRMKTLLSQLNAPKSLVATVNAGVLPPDNWHHDPEVGGGRILAEGCHFIDLLRHIAGAPILRAKATYLGGVAGRLRDTASLELGFADGSIGTVHYFGNGDMNFPKERIEVFCAGRVLQLDNFRVLRGFGWKGFSLFKTSRQDKGHRAGFAAFVNAVESGGPAPIPSDEMFETSRIAVELARQLE